MGIITPLTNPENLLMWQPASVAGAGFLLSFLWFIGVAIYRLTLHPLAKYPGPLLSRISYWPTVFQALSGDRHITHWKEHEIYGNIIRIGPNMLSVNTKEGLKAIYSSGKANVQKGWYYEVLQAASKEWTTHSMIDRSAHAHRRRIMSHAFSDKAIRNAEDFILQNVRTWTDVLGEPKPTGEKDDGWSLKRNMGLWSTYLNFDIMGDLAFGKSFSCMLSEANRWVPEIIVASSGFIYVLGYMPILGLIKPLIGGKFMEKYGGKMAAENVRLIGYCSKLMDERVAKEEGNKAANPDEIRKDFTHYLLESRDPQTGKGYSQAELQSEAALIVVAGADTTSVTLSATIFYLVHYPQVLAKLATEIRTAFSDVEEIRVGQTLGSLVYLRAVIDETLRISPPIPGLLPREVLPGGIEIDGNLIPSGTQVGASAYAIHHNEEYFPNAFTYWPERWIVDPETGVSEKDVAQAHSAFCAFSLGTRGCIGKGLAYAELTVTLGRLLFLFDLREAEGETIGGGKPELGFGRKRKNEYQIKDRFVGERDGPVIEFKARVVST